MFLITLFAIVATLAQVSWVGFWFANTCRSLLFSKRVFKNCLVCFNRTVQHALSPSNAQMGRWCAHPCPSHPCVPHVQLRTAARTSSAPTSGAKTTQVSNFDYKMLLIILPKWVLPFTVKIYPFEIFTRAMPGSSLIYQSTNLLICKSLVSQFVQVLFRA